MEALEVVMPECELASLGEVRVSSIRLDSIWVRVPLKGSCVLHSAAVGVGIVVRHPEIVWIDRPDFVPLPETVSGRYP